MIYTRSKFNYGQAVTLSNKYISFKEGAGPELIAVINEGNYSLGDFASAVQDALNVTGALDYLVVIDRVANQMIINATGNFKLLTNTGTTLASSAFGLMGFNYPAADLTGDHVYKGNGRSGSEYYPQFYLQSYVPPENFQTSVGAIVNESADGRVEVVRFGVKKQIEMEIKFITNLAMDGTTIRSNPNGLADAQAFFQYITQKKKFEFVPDVNNPETFYKVILEAAPGIADGTGYKLKENFDIDMPDVYETGLITLRVVT